MLTEELLANPSLLNYSVVLFSKSLWDFDYFTLIAQDNGVLHSRLGLEYLSGRIICSCEPPWNSGKLKGMLEPLA